MMLVTFYKTQSIISLALIVFRLQIPPLKEEREYIGHHREVLMTRTFLEKIINSRQIYCYQLN